VSPQPAQRLRASRRPCRSSAARHSDLAAATMTSGLSLRKLFSPIPRMFIRSSTFLKPPFFWRYSTIRAAVAGPMPGSSSSSAALAVLTLIAALFGVFGDALAASGCAAGSDRRQGDRHERHRNRHSRDHHHRTRTRRIRARHDRTEHQRHHHDEPNHGLPPVVNVEPQGPSRVRGTV
jgi:hypothetical protein